VDENVYCEKVGTGKVLDIAIIAVSILAIGVLVLTIKDSLSTGSPWVTVVAAVPLLFVVLMLASFRSIKIAISSKELVVKYGFFRKQFFLHEIESCEHVERSGLIKYGGLGVRFGFDNSVAYLTSYGNAVKINSPMKKSFVFSTNQPDKVCQIISTKKQ
jgi:hypothetical protein